MADAANNGVALCVAVTITSASATAVIAVDAAVAGIPRDRARATIASAASGPWSWMRISRRSGISAASIFTCAQPCRPAPTTAATVGDGGAKVRTAKAHTAGVRSRVSASPSSVQSSRPSMSNSTITNVNTPCFVAYTLPPVYGGATAAIALAIAPEAWLRTRCVVDASPRPQAANAAPITSVTPARSSSSPTV